MLRTALKPRWLALLAVVLVAAAGMARLGQWQWDRAHDNAKDKVAARLEQPPVVLESVLKARQTFTGAVADKPVLATGRLAADGQLLVPERRQAGRTGYWVLTPLVLDDGSAIGVVRGWTASPDDRDALAVPDGEVTVEGHLRPAEPPAERAPGQGSGLPAGQVDRIDLTQLIRLWPQPLYTGYVVQTGYRAADGAAAPAVPATLEPVPVTSVEGGIDLRNLSYAAQWFLFAAFGIFMWWRLVRDDHEGRLRQDEPQATTTPEGATL